jgi:hypothetical protein
MTLPSTDNDFSFRLTESILSQTPNSTISSRQQTTPLSENAMVIQPRDSNSSFNHYIGNHFKEKAPVLLDPSRVPECTLWGYLSNDLDSTKHLQTASSINNKTIDDTWYEYDTMTYSTANHLFSLGAFFFMFGFLFPPFWWVGSFYPTRVYDESKTRYDCDVKMLKRWRTLNRFFSLGFSTLLIIAIIVLTILYSKVY